MLQRLFSRGASRDRIEDAIEHSSEAEQRDALRERSAMILQRLENKRLEARRAELEHKRAELEAAEEADRDAAAASAAAEEIAETEPADEEAETGMAEAAPMEIAEERVGAVEDFDEPYARDYDDDGTPGLAEAPFRETHPDIEHAVFEDEAVRRGEAYEDVSAEAHTESVEFRPLEEPEDREDVTEEAAPASFAETDVEDNPAALVEPEDVDLPEAAVETEYEAEEPAFRSRSSEEMFADSEPLRPAADLNLPFSLSRDDGDPAAGEAHRSTLAEEDPDAYEQLLRKAEEAKARIAKRLEALKADEGANAATSLLDIGAAAPPLAPDHGDAED